MPHFGHLASLVWAKLILGRFRDAVLPDFSRFPAGSDDYLNAFFTDPRHGRYCGRYVPGGLRICVCVFCLLLPPFRIKVHFWSLKNGTLLHQLFESVNTLELLEIHFP